MNRTTFLFLALLIVSCIVTVNSRHEARTLITQKTVLNDKVTALQESIRRLELANARVSAKTCPLPIDPAVPPVRPVAPKPFEQEVEIVEPVRAPALKVELKAKETKPVSTKIGESRSIDETKKTAEPKQPEVAKPIRRPSTKPVVAKDEDALDKAMDNALKR